MEETPPAVEAGGPEAGDIANAPPGGDMAMLYHVPAAGEADIVPAAVQALPVVASAGTGQDTRVGVDLAAADRATEGWPWWGKALVAGGCVVVAGIVTYAIVDACNGGSHDGDSSSHLTLGVGGENNTVTVNYRAEGGGNTSSSTTSSENRSEYK